MEYLQIIFLFILKKFNGSRTVFGAFHILKGKKTAQTIQDCQLFGISPLFGVLRQLDREEVLNVINQLKDKNYVTSSSENRFFVTEKGEAALNEQLLEKPIPDHLNGFAYKDVTDIFWSRLALLTQCLSYIKSNSYHFIPVTKDAKVQLWIKETLKRNHTPPSQLCDQLYEELNTVLQSLDSLDATVFVFKLSGAHRVGLTSEQIARKFKLDSTYVKLVVVNGIHQIITIVKSEKNRFPILFNILENIELNSLLTDTAKKTYELLQKGYSLNEICNTRLLKLSTIEDHIVEIAINNSDFSISPFVDKETEETIVAIVRKLKTRRLKDIKIQLKKEITYFQIRLTLARRGF